MSDFSHSPSSCPYLGLPDDSRTSLAYPSLWNHCYRVNHPAPIALAHQGRICLNSFDQCPVYKAGERSSAQADAIGSTKTARETKRQPGKWLRILLVALLLVFVVGGILLARFLVNMPAMIGVPGLRSAPLNTTVLLVSHTAPTPVAATAAIQDTVTDPQTTVTQLPATISVVPGLEATQQLTATSIPLCGHPLDVPFGENVQFILHRILPGENLTKLAALHQTTEQSIVEINYDMPIPVWVDQLVVIPIGVANTNGLPQFETYYLAGEETSMEDLAIKLHVDPQTLQKYNHFAGQCTSYSGWFLIPRTTDPTLE